MRIAVLHHGDDTTNDYAAYLSAVLEEKATGNQYAVTDYYAVKRFPDTLPAGNMVMHIVSDAGSRLALQYWYRVKLPHIFSRLKIDRVIGMYGITAETALPQVLVLPDTGYASAHKESPAWRQFASKRLQKSLAASGKVLAYSQAAAATLAGWNASLAAKTVVVPFSAGPQYKPLEWHDKLYVKSRFADNREFFAAILQDDDIDGFTNLLKAFSRFKKWQNSGMQLILLPKEEVFASSIETKLQTYKYRTDVKLINDADKRDTAEIIGTCYALLHLPRHDGDLLPVVAAMQCGTPVIAATTPSLQEYCGTCAVLTDATDPDSLGNALISLYKDEPLRSKLSDAALEKAPDYSYEAASEQIWQLAAEGNL